MGITFVLIVLVFKIVFFPEVKKDLYSPIAEQPTNQFKISPTLKSYTDDSGFSINYPDNLSLQKNEASDSASYADVTLSAQGLEGSLNLKISDTKLASLDEWIKSNKVATDSAALAKLGTLQGRQIQLQNDIILGALDRGILFTIDVPKNDSWKQILKILAADFSFTAPTQAAAVDNSSSSDDVVFEGEDAVQ